jgi:hypothetical protein
VLAASIIRAMCKPHARNRFEIWEPVGQGRTLARPVGKRVRSELIKGIRCYGYTEWLLFVKLRTNAVQLKTNPAYLDIRPLSSWKQHGENAILWDFMNNNVFWHVGFSVFCVTESRGHVTSTLFFSCLLRPRSNLCLQSFRGFPYFLDSKSSDCTLRMSHDCFIPFHFQLISY